MKILLSMISLSVSSNGFSNTVNLIKNDGYEYNLSNLEINHNWDPINIENNDININLYGLDDIGIKNFNVYEQVCYSLDSKFASNEFNAFSIYGKDLFFKEISNSVISPFKILKLNILNYSNNWLNNNMITAVTTDNIFNTQTFKDIEHETNNEIYSLNIEASINDPDSGWDPNGKFDFSLNITSMDYKDLNTSVWNNDIFGTNGQYKPNYTDNNIKYERSENSAKNSLQERTAIETLDLPFNSVSSQFTNIDIDKKYIKKIQFNMDVMCKTHYTHESSDDAKIDKNFSGDTFDLDDTNLHNISEEQNIESKWDTLGLGVDSFTNDIHEKFYFGKHADTYGYASKYLDTTNNKLSWRFMTAGCGTSAYSYLFSILYHIDSVKIQFQDNIWDNILK